MKQDSISEQTNTEFDSLLAESISNSKLKEGTIIKGIVAEIENDAIIVDSGVLRFFNSFILLIALSLVASAPSPNRVSVGYIIKFPFIKFLYAC